MCFHPYFTVLFFYTSPSSHVSAPSSSRQTREHTPFLLCSSLPPCREMCVCVVAAAYLSQVHFGQAELQAGPWGEQEW